jgi:sugar lactone lactonase YvrE
MKTDLLNLLLATVAGLTAILAPASARADTLFVTNNGSNTIEKFTSSGVGTVFASTGLSGPTGLIFDSSGNLYVANQATNTITKFTLGGVSSVFASDPGDGSVVSSPIGLAFDSSGHLYVANTQTSTIEKFTTGGVGSRFASPSVNVDRPAGVAFDSSGNLYVASAIDNTIGKITPGGVVSTFASVDSGLYFPYGLAFDSAGNLYASNNGNNTILKFTPGGVSSVFVPNAGLLNRPLGLAFDSAGNLYVADSTRTIFKITSGGVGTIFASDPGDYSVLNFPENLAFQPTQVPVRAAGFATAIPGGTGNFISLPGAPGFSATGGVAFYGAGSGGQQGIYVSAQGPPIKAADTNDAIPGGIGNFTAFFMTGMPTVPSIGSDGSVAFFGAGNGGQQGIYVSVQGPPIRIADTATAIPAGTGNFMAFSIPGNPVSPAISSTNVAFFGAGTGGQQGIYGASVSINGPPIKIADTTTAIPGGTGTFTAFAGNPFLSGDRVAFLANGAGGQQGVYGASVSMQGPPIKIADTTTAIPGGTGTFTAFPGNPSLSGDSVAFVGSGIGGQQGVYGASVSVQGPPIKIVDTATAIPGGTGTFTGFGNVSLSATDVAFLGFGASGQQGIYDMTGGTLVRVVGLNDILDGRAITALQFSPTGLSGDPLAFEATLADGSQGIYTSNVLPPFVVRFTAEEKLGNDLRLSFTSMAGASYSVQSCADLSSGSWTTIPGTTTAGTGDIIQITLINAFAQTRQFYRVQQEP